MLLYFLLFSTASTLELLLNSTISQLDQAAPSSSTSSIYSPSSALDTTQASSSGASSTFSASATGIPTGNLQPCEPGSGQCCSRLPEQPYYHYILPGQPYEDPAGNPSYFDPWQIYPLSQSDAAALASASSCGLGFSSQISEYLASAPITVGSLVQATSTAITRTAETATETSVISIISTVSIDTTFTVSDGPNLSGTVTGTYSLIETVSLVTLTRSGYTVGISQSAYYPYQYAEDFSFKPTSPCCSSCTIYGGDVQVYYWPTATAAPSAQATGVTNSSSPQTLVDAAGFTL
jgi:hypothetical protein